MYLIRQLASKYDLTRTALLHYDSIGLLTPSKRTKAGYRLYSEEDEKRLEKILLFRSMGISLDEIKQLLAQDDSNLAGALTKRLGELNREIRELKQQQQNIIDLLKEVKVIELHLAEQEQDLDVFSLLAIADPTDWHQQFEEVSPELHREFLKIMSDIPDDMKCSLINALQALPPAERDELKAITRAHENTQWAIFQNSPKTP